MDHSVKLPESDANDALDSTTHAAPSGLRQPTASADSSLNPRTRRELERYMEERALEKELDSLWQ